MSSMKIDLLATYDLARLITFHFENIEKNLISTFRCRYKSAA